MKQNKCETGTVYFACDRKNLAKTEEVLRYGDRNIFITMYGDDIPYVYRLFLPEFVDEAPHVSEDTDIFKSKYMVYKLSAENKEMLAYNKISFDERRNWFSEQIGQKVIAIYKPNGELVYNSDLQRRANCGMTVILILADEFKYIPTEKCKEPAIKETAKLVVYEKLCLDSVKSTLNKFGLSDASLKLSSDNTIQISFSNNYNFTGEIRKAIEQKQDEIISLLYNGKFKKAMEESRLKPKFSFHVHSIISFEVKE